MHRNQVESFLLLVLVMLCCTASFEAQSAGFPVGAGQASGPAGHALLTLDKAVEAVLARSPLRQSAMARLDASRAAASVAAVWANPSLEVRAENWTFDRWQWAPAADPLRVPVDFLTVLTQPFELGGQRGARRGIAQAELLGAEAELRRVDRMLALQTVRAYLDVVKNRELLAALTENQDSLDVLVTALDARVREGVAPASDLARFRAEAARITMQTLRTRIELERHASVLGSLIGDPGLVDPFRLVAPGPPPLPAGTPDEAVKRVVEASPEVLAARARAAVMSGSAALERAKRVPDLGVTGGYKRTAGVDSAVVGVLVALPLFDQNKRNVALAEGGARASGFEVLAAEARASADGHVLIRHARALTDRAASVDRDLVEPADVVRTAARAAFREGAAEILTLVDAERLYLDAHREALQLRVDAIAAAFELKLALGEEIHR